MSAPGADTAACRGKSSSLYVASKPEDLPANVASGLHHRVLSVGPAASFLNCGCFTMIKNHCCARRCPSRHFLVGHRTLARILVVTANRFQQPVNTVLAPTDVVTREDIQRWQSKDLNDVMRRLPGVDISQSGGMGKSSSLYVRGTESRHVLVLIDGVPMARAGIGNAIDIGQIPVSLVQRVEYIRGPRSAVYGSGAIGGVVNIITMSDEEKSQINAGMGTDGYQTYDGSVNKRFGDTMVTAAGAYQTTKGFNIQPDSPYSGDSDRDGYRNKLFWGGVQHKFSDNVSGFFRGYGYTANSDYDQGSWGNPGGNDEAQNYTQSWDSGLRYSSGIYSSQLIANYQHLKDYNYSNELGRYAETLRWIIWNNAIFSGEITLRLGMGQLAAVSTGNKRS